MKILVIPDVQAKPGVNFSFLRRIGYRLENVGEISNRGWEAQGSAELGPLALDGSFALVDSRVRRVAGGLFAFVAGGPRSHSSQAA